MREFSNINWAAFLLGGLWGFINKYYLWGFSWFAVNVFANVILRAGIYYDIVSGSTIVAVSIGSRHILMATIAVYLAMKGNEMTFVRMWHEQRAGKHFIPMQKHKQVALGLLYRLLSYALIVYSALTGVHSMWILPLVLAIDMLSLAALLLLALRYHPKNELPSNQWR